MYNLPRSCANTTSSMELSVIEDISVFKYEYMDMLVPALIGVGEGGEVKLRDRVGGGAGIPINLRETILFRG